MNENSNWEENLLQFPRLLAEINAVGLSDGQLEALSIHMDLPVERILEIFERAEKTWDMIKEKI